MAKKEFKLDQRVRFINLPEDCNLLNEEGIILGKCFENVTDHYIVLLDNPTKTHKAIGMTESCLEAL